MPHPPLPPRRIGRLADEILDLDGPPAVIDAAAVFRGEGLAFAVRGGGAGIDPATGRLSLPADRLRDGVRVTVTARNAAGVAHASLRVTVEAPLAAMPADTAPMAEVSRHGVTFRFAEPRPVGRYVTGDPFVVGPVTVVAIDPPSAAIGGTARHGAQVDPGPEGNGFDGRIGEPTVAYDPALNLDPAATGQPLAIDTGTLVKAVSRSDAEGLAHSGFTWLDRYVTLTVVAAPPPEDAFRPSVIGRDTRARWREADIRYDRLADLEPVARMPTLQEAAEAAAPLMPAWFFASAAAGHHARQLHAARHFVGYGRDMGRTLADAMLATHRRAPVAEKRPAVVGLVQAGLDLCAQIAAGRGFGLGGAITTGRKPVAVYAATLLDDPELLRIVNSRTAPASWGNADHQFLWITEDLIGPVHDRPSAPTRPAHTPFAPEHLGFPEWRENGTRLTASLAADYRHLAGEPEARGLLALLLTEGAAEAWGDALPFAYADRLWRWYQGDARNLWSVRANPPWRMTQLPPRWVLVWHAAHRGRLAPRAWEGAPEQMWPPEVERLEPGLSLRVRPDRFRCANGGEILRVDLRWRLAGASRWETVEDVPTPVRIDGLSGDAVYEVQTRAVSTLGPGAWSTNLPRFAEEPAQAVVHTAALPSPPVNWDPPSVAGRPRPGATLTAAPGLWAGHPAPALALRWEREGPAGFAAIPGATGATFVPGPDDRGLRLRCSAEASNASGRASIASAPTAPVGD